ncbi:AMP-activated serine/threonine-protein kinase regulatory subunit [Malassezia equina]|uniref:AMP-activated serine/threonine-protein kinase regulatory subunit n=1 Tax=Malassezia equina TaxID=1381935 RepID=A0AAF0ECA4_9BASI|nr:AMP-activated serine/threonine-protein kinase regulatory subunit [Malassezia equina]
MGVRRSVAVARGSLPPAMSSACTSGTSSRRDSQTSSRRPSASNTGENTPNDGVSVSAAVRRVDRRLAQLKDHHLHALHAIRHFLRTHSSYDVLPVSFRLVVLDVELSIQSALEVMFQSGVVSAPLWRSTLHETSKPGFAGMLTVNDIIHLIQYYYYTSANYDSAKVDVQTMRLEHLRAVEQALDVQPPPLLSMAPLRSLAEAGEMLVRTHARRIPLLEYNDDLKIETVLSVLTQYRLLKFIAMNCRETAGLKASIGSLGIGTYTYAHQLERRRRAPQARLRLREPPPADAGPHWPLLTATLDTTVFDVVHMFSENEISAVPILDANGDVVDLYESVDVITLVRTGTYYQLDLTIRQALERRPADYAGVSCCSSNDSLASVFDMLKQRRMHRMLVVEPTEAADESAVAASPTSSDVSQDSLAQPMPLCPKGQLVGMLSLSDILRYIIGQPATQTPAEPMPTRSPEDGTASSVPTPMVAPP